jgi:hypothetical protein
MEYTNGRQRKALILKGNEEACEGFVRPRNHE